MLQKSFRQAGCGHCALFYAGLLTCQGAFFLLRGFCSGHLEPDTVTTGESATLGKRLSENVSKQLHLHLIMESNFDEMTIITGIENMRML